MKILRVALLVLLVVSCSNYERSKEAVSWILTADPESDAISAVEDGDYRLVGISGMLLNEVPLIDKSCKYGSNVRYLHVDDVVDSYAEKKYQVIAPVYAESYNYHLIKYLRKEGIEICNS